MLGKLIVVISVLGCFCALSSYSWARTHTPLRHVMEDRAAKVVHLFRTKQAAVLADVYGISADEVGNPIAIWGK